MNETKPAIQSLGVWGITVAFMVIVFGQFGIDLSADVVGLPETIAKTVDNVTVLAGLLAGIVGRIRARKKIAGFLAGK